MSVALKTEINKLREKVEQLEKRIQQLEERKKPGPKPKE